MSEDIPYYSEPYSELLEQNQNLRAELAAAKEEIRILKLHSSAIKLNETAINREEES